MPEAGTRETDKNQLLGRRRPVGGRMGQDGLAEAMLLLAESMQSGH